MKRITALICILLVGVLSRVCLAEGPASSSPPAAKLDAGVEALLVKMEKQTKSTNTISCEFTLTRYSAIFEVPSVKVGKLYYKKPEMVRIDFEKPDHRQFFVNQKRWWDYRPEANLVRTGKRDNKKQGSDILALDLWRSPEKLRKEFALRLLRVETTDKQKLHLLEVTPKDKKTKLEYIRILSWVDEKLLLPIKIQCLEKSEDTVTYEFKKIKTNPKLSSRMFQFRKKRGTIVEDVDQKQPTK